jgi:hypothetical protein
MKTVTRSLQVLMVFVLLALAFQSSAQTTVTVGSGTVSCSYPYATYWGGARSQFIYTAAQLTAAGAVAGTITSMGYNVISYDPYLMNNFYIRMTNTALTSLTSWQTGLTTVRTGTYSVPGTGWQMVTLTTPFLWNGTSNLLVEVCYDNGYNYSYYSYVNGTTAPAGQIRPYYMDGSGGCSYTGSAYTGYTGLPNFRFVETPLVTGNLTGTVRNCYTNATMAGVSVSCGGVGPVLTNGSGVYTLTGIVAGPQTITATFGGFTNYSNPVSVIGNTTTTYNFCMSPIPGIINGVVTNAANSNPVVGAKVAFGTNYTYSVAGGLYSLSVYPGATNALQCSKEGFNLYSQSGVTVSPPATITIDIALAENTPAPSPIAPSTTLFSAVLNGAQTAVNLNWGLPLDDMVLLYDDGIQDNFAIWASGGGDNLNAMKFTPISYPTVIKGFYFNIGTAANYPGGSNAYSPVQLAIYSDNGGIPGVELSAPTTITPTVYGWSKANFDAPVTLTSGNFFIVWIQQGNATASPGLAIDTTIQQMRSFSNFGGLMWVPGPGNYMIRAIVNGSGGPLLLGDQSTEPITASAVEGLIYQYAPATVTGVEGSPKVYPEMGYNPDNLLGYQVWRLLQTQEATPALWTSLGVTTATNYVDNGWPSVVPPCGAYRWAAKAQYTFNRWSNATFSNVIGKCWTCNVTLNVDLSCDSVTPEFSVVKFQNQDVVDTVYNYIMDATGTHIFANFWKGNYTLNVTKFGYTPYVQTNIPIFGDVTINVMLLQIKAAPTGLHVVDSTLFANWFPPVYEQVLFNETFSSGSFATNGWVPDGGSNWVVSGSGGNPGQCARWNYSPQVTNYSQSLTSKTLQGAYSPIMKLYWDVHLNNYGNTTLNQMAVEVWNGTIWTSVGNYDNSTGSDIAWTTGTADISNLANGAFKVRFRAYGEDSFDVDWWDIDNVKVVASTIVSPNPCVIGYNFYLNSVLDGFTQDTFYNIPPASVSYGSAYHACVLAIYGSGYSAQSCYDFTSKFLCPPNTLAVQGIESTAYLTWQKPNCGGCTLATYQYDNTLENAYAINPTYNIQMGNYFPVTPAGTMGIIKSFDVFFVSYGTWTAQPTIIYVYDAAHTLIGQSPSFINGPAAPWPSGTWINVAVADIPYTGPFYALIDYYVPSGVPKNGLGVDNTTPQVIADGLAWCNYAGTWGSAASIIGTGYPSTWKQRANVCVIGKKGPEMTTIDPSSLPSSQGTLVPGAAVNAGPNVSGNAGDPVTLQAPAAVTLLGYRVFRDNVKIADINDPNTLEYYDTFLNPGNYCYKVDGWYNVAPFNPPTLRDNSQPAGPECVNIAYGYPLPFYEPWTQASFGYQNWTLPAGQANWSINTALGNPLPCADFSWQPMVTNYDISLTSPAIDASAWTCADIWLDLDVKLVDRNATGDEKLDIDIKVNGNWINKASLSNTGSMDWTMKHLDITNVKGKAFQIRLRAYGANSADLLHWYVDNIHAYGVCHAPQTLTGVQNQFTTTLTWAAPACGGGGPTPQWIHWDDGTNSTSIGYGTGAAVDFYIAARWTPTQIAPLDGGSVTKIKFWPASAGTATWRARIWEGANAANLVVDQNVTQVLTPDAWNEVILTTPHPINIGQELWIGFDVNQTDGWPAGCDPGPAITEYGDWIYDGGAWTTLLLSGLDYNWNIQAYVEPSKKEAGSIPTILTNNTASNPKGLAAGTSGRINNASNRFANTGTGRIAPLSPMGSQLMGYNIYRTDDNTTTPFFKIAGPVPGPTYADIHPSTTEPTTTWKYYVTSVFQDSLNPGPVLCEGVSDTITITFPAVGINDLSNNGLMIYPNPANDLVNISATNDIKTIEILNYIGQTIYTNNNVNMKKVQLNVSTYKAGVYFVKITTTSGIRTSKVTVTH